MTIKSVAHVCIKTKDLERTLEFYCDAVGMQKLFRFTREGAAVGFYLKAANDTFIEVFHANDAGQGKDRRVLHHFCLETDSIEELRERLIKKGYAPREMIIGADQSLQFWVEDPNGLDIEFQQYTGQSSQLTGTDVPLK
jgi:lactoylglutathione lyase